MQHRPLVSSPFDRQPPTLCPKYIKFQCNCITNYQQTRNSVSYYYYNSQCGITCDLIGYKIMRTFTFLHIINETCCCAGRIIFLLLKLKLLVLLVNRLINEPIARCQIYKLAPNENATGPPECNQVTTEIPLSVLCFFIVPNYLLFLCVCVVLYISLTAFNCRPHN